MERDYAAAQQTDLAPLTEAEQQAVRQLGRRPAGGLGGAPTTTPADRKRLLRLAIAAVTVMADRAAHRIDAVILWTGGATSTHTASLPPVGLHAVTDAAVISRIRELSRDRPDHAVAQALNAAGLRTQTGKEWTYARVQSMRKLYAIPTGCPIRTGSMEPRADGRCSGRAAARRLGVSPSLVHLWVQHGIISCDQRCSRSKLWVRLTDTDIALLDGSADVSRLPTLTECAPGDGDGARGHMETYPARRLHRLSDLTPPRSVGVERQERAAAGGAASPGSIESKEHGSKAIWMTLSDAADRRLDTGLGQSLGVLISDILRPRSLWWIRPPPLAGRRSWSACSRASRTSWPERCGHPPADDPAGERVDDKGHVDKALPGRDIREIRHPQGIGPRRLELPVHLVRRARRRLVTDRRPHRLAAHYALQTHAPHQARHRAPATSMPSRYQLPPDLADAIDLEVSSQIRRIATLSSASLRQRAGALDGSVRRAACE